MKSKYACTASLVLVLLLILGSTIPPRIRAQIDPVTVAPGFEFNIFADPTRVPDFSTAFSGPVSMAFDSRGRLFVGTYPGRILIMLDNDQDGRVDQIKTFATGLIQPLGLEFHANGDLYLTSNPLGGAGRIIRLRDLNGDDVADETTIIIDGLPSEGDHQTDRLKFGPDGLLYFGQGSSTDAGTPDPGRPPERQYNASVLKIDVNNPAISVVATGLRNPFGMAFHPVNGELFTTDGGSGELGQLPDTSPLEEINWIVTGSHYGFPGCEGPPIAGEPACVGVRGPIATFTPHLTPTSITFYTGPQAGDSTNQMLVTLFKRRGTGGDLQRFILTGSAVTGFETTRVDPSIIEFGLIDPNDGPVDTAIDPISGDIYVARFDPVFHRDPNEHHHFIYRVHRAGSDALPFIGAPRPSAIRAGSSGVTITLVTRHVKPGAVVFDVTNGVPLTTRPGASNFELVADLPASALATVRTLTLEVRNPDGTPSNQKIFAVTSGDPDPPPPPGDKIPHLTSMFVFKKKRSKVRDQLFAGENLKKFRLVVSGTDFDAGAQLLVNNTPLAIESSSTTELVGRMVSSLAQAAGELNVQVRNSAGKISNTLKLTISP